MIDKIYLYPKDLSEPKYEFLIKKREDVGIKHLNYHTMDGVHTMLWMMCMRKKKEKNINCF